MTVIKYEFHEMIAEAFENIYGEMFSEDELPSVIEYDVKWQPAFDAYILQIYTNWEFDRTNVDFSFILDTGTGGREMQIDTETGRLVLQKKQPEYSDVQITKTLLDNNEEEIKAYEWNVKIGKWKRSLTSSESYFLDKLSPELKRDFNIILKWLQDQEDGYTSTTANLWENLVKLHRTENDYFLKLDKAINLGAIERGFYLDKSSNNNEEQSNPWDIDFRLLKSGDLL